MTAYMWKVEKDPDSASQEKIQEFYTAIKDTRMARLYYPIFCLRRLALVSSLLILEHMDGKIRLG